MVFGYEPPTMSRACLSVEEVAAYVDAEAVHRSAYDHHVDTCEVCRRAVAAAVRAARPPLSDAPTLPVDHATAASQSGDYSALVVVDPQHYARDKEIARGGMGRIIVARDRRLGRPVAIKELRAQSEGLRARFEREARITGRLQHPGIVNLHEAGTWPTGEPFYAMKLVSGESLDQAIDRRTTLESRLALLPNVVAAVDALAYAHSMRIIHRDLKPANVLVGRFGETVVIDWGLAKDLAGPGEVDIAVGPYRRPSADVDATVEGAVIGTPAYMPPEQARGDTVDERADVYALGAMLYHVLTGQPPYHGSTVESILHKVLASPPPPLPARTPADLVALVNKAMARDAADRYPTAIEMAEDLKRFQTGQLVGAHRYSFWHLARRWVRRRTAVAVGIVAAIALVAVGVVSVSRIVTEQSRTEQERRSAERHRGEAEQLMSFMLVDLRDKLEPRAQLDLLDDVAKRAAAYYDRRGEASSLADLSNRAMMRNNLGDVLVAQGHSEAALAQYRLSQSLYDVLAATDPHDVSRRRSVAVGHKKIGDVLRTQDKLAAALVEYRRTLAMMAALAAEQPSDTERQIDLANAHESIGALLLQQGEPARALAELRPMVAIATALAARDPDNPKHQMLLVVSHDKVGNAHLDNGDPAQAIAEYRASIAISEALSARDPKNRELRRNLGVGHENIGDAIRKQSDTAGALAEYRASLTILEALAADDPTNADRQSDTAVAHQNVGDMLQKQGDTTGALASYRAMTAVVRALADKEPTNAKRQRMLGICINKVGETLLKLGKDAEATAQFRAALAIETRLVERDPDNRQLAFGLSVTHQRLGDALFSKARNAAALAEYRASQSLLAKLAAADPSAQRQEDLTIGHERLGDTLLAMGDVAGALAEQREALAILLSLSAADPANLELQYSIAEIRANVGDALAKSGNKAGARAEYRVGLAAAEALALKDTTNADIKGLVAELSRKLRQ